MSVCELRQDCVEGKVFWEIGCYEEAENAKSPVQAFLTTPQYLSSKAFFLSANQQRSK